MALKVFSRIVILISIVFVLGEVSSAKSCLPKLDIPSDWLRCHADEDCVIYSEACRSCSGLIALNKKFIPDLTALDMGLRKKNNCLLSCEACQIPMDKSVACRDLRCQISSKK
jgi:hypothetical protein